MPFTFRFPQTHLPPPESSLINTQLPGQRFPAQPMPPPVGEQFFTEGFGFGVGIISEELNDPRPMPHGRMAAVFFPVGIGLLLQIEASPQVTLEESQLHAPLLKVLPQGFWFPFIKHWFQ